MSTLHDLLSESVRDADLPDLPDLSGIAWVGGEQARRQRRSSILRSVVAVVVMFLLAGIVVVGGGPDNTADRPDGKFLGTEVWWAPTLGQEARLPLLPGSPLPATVDLSAPAPTLAQHPIPRAVAAYAVSSRSGERVVVVGPDGQLRSVDLSHVKPMTAPSGGKRVDAGPSMLSPSGDYLMFPQDFGIMLLQIATGHWRFLYTIPGLSTWSSSWIDAHHVLVPSGDRYEYSIRRGAPPNRWTFGGGISAVRHPGSRRNGFFRLRNGVAQAFHPGATVPQPPRLGLSPGQSPWVGVFEGRSSKVLVIPYAAARRHDCCVVGAWLGPDTLAYESPSSQGLRLLAWKVTTHSFWRVTQVTGTHGERVVSSYADEG